MVSRRFMRAAVATAAGLIFLAVDPAFGLDLNIGGLSVGVTAGGTHGALSASLGVGDTSAAVSVAPAGSLATISAHGPVASTNVEAGLDHVSLSASVPAARVSVGVALRASTASANRDGVPGFGTRSMRGAGSLTGSQIALAMSAAYTGLPASDQQLLRDRCGLILASPHAFEPSLVALCRFVGSLGIN
jgi:hypothetical protein